MPANPLSLTEYLFVYGTLRRDGGNQMHAVLASHSEFEGPATLQGSMYLISTYPGVVDNPEATAPIQGELYALHAASPALRLLDQYEEYGEGFVTPYLFVRVLREVVRKDGSKCSAWVYLYNQSITGLTGIPGGDFLLALEGLSSCVRPL